jgi:pyruvate dehydrogenase E2 component (dihydrolipoamide acetyltransferase)
MAEELFIPQLGQTVEEVTIVSWHVKDGDKVKQGQEVLEVETDKAVFDVEATGDGIIHIGPYKVGDVVPVLTVVAMIGDTDDSFQTSEAPPNAPAIEQPSSEDDVEELFIPQLGQTVEEVKLINWRVNDGDPVKQGQEVLEVETDKAVFDVEATADGFIHFGPHQIGETVPVLTVVAVIGDKNAGFKVLNVIKETATEASPTIPEAQQITAVVRDKEETERSGKIFASPRARRLAGAKGVDLALVTPTGGHGMRIIEADVEKFLQSVSKPTPSLPVTEISAVVPLKGVRGLIAERMAASVQTTARVTLFMDVDATAFSAMREKLKEEKENVWGFKAGYNDLLARVCAIALDRFPYMNARINGDQIEHISPINIGIAVDAERGLYVPVIRDADQKSLEAIGNEFRQRVEEIRSGKILPELLSGGTFTITNLGMYDVDGFTPVINLPEAAILGVGRILDKAVPVNGKIVIRKMMVLSLAFDHRLVDGAPAAKFMQFIKDLIESPDEKTLTN